MKLFILTLILANLPAIAGFNSCFVSRNGNEFWLRHLTSSNDSCQTTVIMENIEGMPGPSKIEILFNTSQKSISNISVSINGLKSILVEHQNMLNLNLSDLSNQKESIFIGCNQTSTSEKNTTCDGLQAYPSDPTKLGVNLPDINGRVEIIPK